MTVFLITAGVSEGNLSGGALVSRRLIRSLARAGINLLVLDAISGGRRPQVSELPESIRLWKSEPIGWKSNPKVQATVSELARQIIEEHRPDMVHILQYEAWRSALLTVFTEAKLPVIATALDYGWFCPKTTLITDKGLLCDGHGSITKCGPCLSGGREPVTRGSRWIGSRLPGSFASAPFVGALVREAEWNRARMTMTLSDWPRFAKSVAHWIAPSHAMRRLLAEQGIAADQITYIPYGYDAPTSFPKKNTNNDVVFGYAGRGIYEKGFHLLVEAFLAVAQQIKNVRLRLFGMSPDVRHRHTRQCLRKLRPIWHRVDFDSFDGTNPDSIRQAHSKISVMVVPSIWYDNLPLTVVESLAHGTPVIASQHSSASDPVREGINGLLFDAFTPSDLMNKMLEFAKTPRLRESLALARYGRSFADEANEVDHVYQQILSLGA